METAKEYTVNSIEIGNMKEVLANGEYKPEHNLEDWTEASALKESLSNFFSVDALTRKQWDDARKLLGLETRNIGGKWMVRYWVEGNDVEEPANTVEELPLVKPNVVTFGDFSSSLAVVNNVSTDSIQVHNTTFNTGALANEADLFVNQLGAFTEFLNNTEAMLSQREQDLKEQTRIKTEALQQTRLKVETIRQRALVAQRNTIAKQVENQALDVAMSEEIATGKQLHETLQSLQ